MSQSFDINCAKKPLKVEIQQQWWIIARSCLKVQKSRICRIGVRGLQLVIPCGRRYENGQQGAGANKYIVYSAIYSAGWCFSLMVLNVVNQHFMWSIPVASPAEQSDGDRMFTFSKFFSSWVLPLHRKKTRSQKAGGKNQARRQNTSMNHFGITICRGWCTCLLNGQLRAPCFCQASFALKRCFKAKVKAKKSKKRKRTSCFGCNLNQFDVDINIVQAILQTIFNPNNISKMINYTVKSVTWLIQTSSFCNCILRLKWGEFLLSGWSWDWKKKLS